MGKRLEQHKVADGFSSYCPRVIYPPPANPIVNFLYNWQTLILEVFALIAGGVAYLAGLRQATATYMHIRLNGWQRIGLVVSVIWIIAGPIYLDLIAQNHAEETFGRVYDTCRDAQSSRDAIEHPMRCKDEAAKPPNWWRGTHLRIG